MDQKTEQRIKDAIARCPNHASYQIAKNLNVLTSLVVKVRAEMGGLESAEKPSLQGFNLSSRRVLSRRPAESAAKYIKRLPNGKGFSPRDLAHQWGMSEETIKKHARDLGCLKFVEIQEDEWQSLVMSPDTAAQYE